MKRFSILATCAAVVALLLCLAGCASSGSSAAVPSGSSGESADQSSEASVEAAASESTEESEAAASSSEAAAEEEVSSEAAVVEEASSEAAATEEESSEAAAEEEASSEEAAESVAEAKVETAAEAAGNQAAGFDFVDECTDEHGNVTLYALTELKGWQLETLLDQQGYEWDQSKHSWIRPMDGASFSAYKETGVYDQSTYDEMNEKGGAIVAIGFNVVAGYKDPQAALKGNAKCVVEDSYFNGENGIVIFYGPSMKEYLAIIGPYSESTVLFEIFSKEAVGSGMFDEAMGTQVGGSFEEVWKYATGQDSYGH